MQSTEYVAAYASLTAASSHVRACIPAYRYFAEEMTRGEFTLLFSCAVPATIKDIR